MQDFQRKYHVFVVAAAVGLKYDESRGRQKKGKRTDKSLRVWNKHQCTRYEYKPAIPCANAGAARAAGAAIPLHMAD